MIVDVYWNARSNNWSVRDPKTRTVLTRTDGVSLKDARFVHLCKHPYIRGTTLDWTRESLPSISAYVRLTRVTLYDPGLTTQPIGADWVSCIKGQCLALGLWY